VNLTEMDILTPIREPLRQGKLFLTEGEEKIDFAGHVRFTEDFILHKGVPWHKCYMWHGVWFPCYGIIPSPCHNCYKVVVRPKNLDQLFELYRLQQCMDRPSKCGIEGREWVDGLYGGYFYNTGLEEGRECYRAVREEVSKCISPDVSVILKRACTEYELPPPIGFGFGPSDKWVVTPEQERLEERLNESFVQHDYYAIPGKYRRAQLVNIWVRWAASHGDMTYLNYTDGKPFYQKPVTYHED